MPDGLTLLGSHTRTQYAALLLSRAEYKTRLIQSAYKFLGRSATAGSLFLAKSFGSRRNG